MKMSATIMAALLLTTMWLGGCKTAPKTEAGRTSLHKDAMATIDRFKAIDPTLDRFFRESAGYAVFPSVGKGAIGVGGAYGRGELFERGKMIAYCDLSQGTIGLQLGGQAYSEIIFFKNKEALTEFKSGNFTFAAQASAVAATAGSSVDADYDSGVSVFTIERGGLMYEAAIGGQKFSVVPK